MSRNITARPDLSRLDRRNVGYRFALDELPWDLLDAPGLYAGRHLLERLGAAPAIVEHADDPSMVELQWAFGLATAQAFVALERDVSEFVVAAPEPSRSTALLLEEEHKHIHMFERLADGLRRQRPEWVMDFDAAWQPPVSWADVDRHIGGTGQAQRDWLVWLATLFFEEYTVWIHHALDADAEQIQPLWRAAHAAHRREEIQHVLTDGAYLDRSALGRDDRLRLARAFQLFIETHLDRLLCLDVIAEFARRRGLEGVFGAERALSKIPFVDELLAHNAFAHSRRSMPALVHLERARAKPVASAHGDASPAIEGTLVDALERAAALPNAPGVVFVERRGAEQRMSYAELLSIAERRHAGLHARGVRPGDQVLLTTTSARDFLGAFWGCIIGGVRPVPLAPPTGAASGGAQVERLVGVCEVVGRTVIVTDAQLSERLRRLVDDRGLDAVVVIADDLDGPPMPRPSVDQEADAFIQFSSGSTRVPRGLRLTHSNVLHDVLAMHGHRGVEDEVFVSWMPLFHDMGLIGYHLAPVVLGAEQVLLTPELMTLNPMAWLSALSRFGGTVTGATNASLDHLMSRLKPDVAASLDLSALHTWLIGAEPISMAVVEQVAETLAPFGLRRSALCPGYGLAEATLAVTMIPRAEGPRARTVDRDRLSRCESVLEIDADHPRAIPIVDCGTPIAGVEIGIVAADGSPCAPDEIGEIHVRGPTVTAGVLGQGDGPPGPGAGWLATGDLGLIHDGRLFVTGRDKDVFFVAGRTLYAHDVEAVAAQVEGVRDGTCALVVHPADELGHERRTLCLVLTQRSRPREVMAAVAQHVASRTGVALDEIVELRRTDLPRTTSGKLRRYLLGQRLRAGRFEDRWRWSAGSVRPKSRQSGLRRLEDVRRIWAAALELDVDQIGDDTDFHALGGTSIRAADIHRRLEEALGRHFGPELLQFTTVRSMTEHAMRDERRGSAVHEARPTAAAPATPSDSPAVASRTSSQRDSFVGAVASPNLSPVFQESSLSA